MTTNGKPKFDLGQILATPGALEALQESGQPPHFFLARHGRGDWGEVCPRGQALNDQALVDGSRLLSRVSDPQGNEALDHYRGQRRPGPPAGKHLPFAIRVLIGPVS